MALAVGPAESPRRPGSPGAGASARDRGPPPDGNAVSAASGTCALVILSCDGYRDLWIPCLTLYRRY